MICLKSSRAGGAFILQQGCNEVRRKQRKEPQHTSLRSPSPHENNERVGEVSQLALHLSDSAYAELPRSDVSSGALAVPEHALQRQHLVRKK